jgi:hypothetical protein
MSANKEELQERAQLVRVHEANCKIAYPTVDESNFRIAVMKKLGLEFALREMRAASITGQAVNITVRRASGDDLNPVKRKNAA